MTVHPPDTQTQLVPVVVGQTLDRPADTIRVAVNRAEARTEYIKLGRHILEQAFNKEGVSLTDKGLNGTLEKFAVDNLDEALAIRVLDPACNIFILGMTIPARLPEVVSGRLIQTCLLYTSPSPRD